MNNQMFRELFANYKYRILLTILAILFAIVWVIFGFGKALFVLVLGAIGYFIGVFLDDDNALRRWYLKIESWRRR
ncbi:MAG: DUF2273 domain-containing protein [Aerococcus sp.]|nr:DUF2273 domain-containing protein [Aerococcus sp.]